MELVKKLVNFASKLDTAQLPYLGTAVDGISRDLVKVSQYVGVQGYWMRNERCWSNCYRQKRASKPSISAQEVWFECQEEFQKSINNDGSKWDKYAESEGIIKTAEYISDQSNFAKFIESKNATVQDVVQIVLEGDLKTAVINASGVMANISARLDGINDALAKEASDLSEEIIKEAGIGDVFRGIGNSVGGAITGGKIMGIANDVAKKFQVVQQSMAALNQSIESAKVVLGQKAKSGMPRTKALASKALAFLQQQKQAGVQQKFVEAYGNISRQLNQIAGGLDADNTPTALNAQPSPAATTAPSPASGTAGAQATSPASTTPASPNSAAPASTGPTGTNTLNSVKNQLVGLSETEQREVMHQLLMKMVRNKAANTGLREMFSLVKTAQVAAPVKALKPRSPKRKSTPIVNPTKTGLPIGTTPGAAAPERVSHPEMDPNEEAAFYNKAPRVDPTIPATHQTAATPVAMPTPPPSPRSARPAVPPGASATPTPISSPTPVTPAVPDPASNPKIAPTGQPVTTSSPSPTTSTSYPYRDSLRAKAPGSPPVSPATTGTLPNPTPTPPAASATPAGSATAPASSTTPPSSPEKPAALPTGPIMEQFDQIMKDLTPDRQQVILSDITNIINEIKKKRPGPTNNWFTAQGESNNNKGIKSFFKLSSLSKGAK